MKSQTHTAVLLFAESAGVQSGKKVLDASCVRSFSLLKSLESRSIKVAKQSGLDLIHLDESLQHGENFGERLANALQHVFSLGYSNVIAVGSDCPDLTANDLRSASDKLEVENLVIGPDLRGGAYLIGINKNAFDADQFIKLAWQDPTLRASLVRYARKRNFSIDWLDKKADFNEASEVKRYWKLSAKIRRLISQLEDHLPVSFVPQLHYSYIQAATTSRRGPPVS